MAATSRAARPGLRARSGARCRCLSPAVPLLRGRRPDKAFRGHTGTCRRLVVRGLGGLVHAGQQRPTREGRPQGLSTVDIPGAGPVTLLGLGRGAARGDGRRSASRSDWGPGTGVLVKLLSPAGQVPLHAHPTRDWAWRHLRLAVRQDRGLDPAGHARRRRAAYAGDRLRSRYRPAWFADAVRRHDTAAIRGTLQPHRGAPRRGVRGARGRAALPGAADLVHRDPGAQRPHRDPGDVRARRRRAPPWAWAGTWPWT